MVRHESLYEQRTLGAVKLARRRRFECRTELKAIRHARIVSWVIVGCHELATSVESANIDLEVHRSFPSRCFSTHRETALC